MPNWSQISGVVERLVTAIVMFAAGKGWLSSGDTANIVGLIMGLSAAIYAYVVNRPTNLAKQAASVPGTIVVTSDAIAESTTAKNIVSSQTTKVTNTMTGRDISSSVK